MSFVLAHSLLGEPAAPKLLLLLHGALGSGNNLRSLALKLCKLRPEYRCCLVDLRHHGQSQGAPLPNTLGACAEDLLHLERALGHVPEVMVGHSFGGKVALMFAAQHPARLKQLWILDSNPGPQAATPDHEVLRVIRAVRGTRLPVENRADVVAQLSEQGLSSGLAQWLATNLKREPSGFVWGFNLEAIHELMLDYFASDLWSVLEHPTRETDFRVVVGERSDRWAAENRERLERLVAATHVRLHVVPEAGHWLHVDNPGYLLELFARDLY